MQEFLPTWRTAEPSLTSPAAPPMARRLVASGRYSRVLGLDYPEAMLRETRQCFDEERIATDALTLVRADAGALPLASGTIDALCRRGPPLAAPRAEPQRGRAEFEAGRSLFATTFFEGVVPGQQQSLPGGQMRMFKDEDELTELLPAQDSTRPLDCAARDARVRSSGGGAVASRGGMIAGAVRSTDLVVILLLCQNSTTASSVRCT